VANQGTNDVSVIDIANNTVLPITLSVSPNSHGVAITPDGLYAYVANSTANTVSVIDITNNIVLPTTIAVGTEPQGIAITPNGLLAYVTNQASYDVSVIWISDNTVLKTIPVGDYPLGIAITPNGDYVYVANDLSNTVSVIRISDNTVIKTIPVGLQPRGLAITPDGAFCYVANSFSSDLSVIEIASNTNVATISGIGVFPWGVAITPNGDYAYVTNAEMTGSVAVIEISSKSFQSTISVGSIPRELAITPDGKYVYVASVNAAMVSVVDISNNNTVMVNINVGGSPTGIAITPQALQCVTLPSDMVAWWPLDETTGTTANDIVGFNSFGTHYQGPVPVPGKVDGALSFDGADDYLETEAYMELDFGVGDFSIDAWIFWDAFSVSEAPIVSKWYGGDDGYYFLILNGKLTLGLADGAGSTYYFDPIAHNLPICQWLHVAVSVDRNDPMGLRFYVNGTSYGSALDPTNRQGTISNPDSLRIGSSKFTLLSVNTPQFFGGNIDEVELFNRALSASEIQDIYNAGNAGKCKTPVSIDEDQTGQLPQQFFLEQNYPNPFNPETVITYALPKAGEVSLIVFDIRGRKVAQLVNDLMPAGYHSATWNASGFASGIYFNRLQTDDFVQTRKMVLLK
ncbi:MAG: beta-propeller fold lactonase family protein, partial [candidate division Zixibacteria bacterium]|nr:beta-propeller fold lactonase family protein [candidate division Zixibacteria bacterium]